MAGLHPRSGLLPCAVIWRSSSCSRWHRYHPMCLLVFKINLSVSYRRLPDGLRHVGTIVFVLSLPGVSVSVHHSGQCSPMMLGLIVASTLVARPWCAFRSTVSSGRPVSWSCWSHWLLSRSRSPLSPRNRPTSSSWRRAGDNLSLYLSCADCAAGTSSRCSSQSIWRQIGGRWARCSARLAQRISGSCPGALASLTFLPRSRPVPSRLGSNLRPCSIPADCGPSPGSALDNRCRDLHQVLHAIPSACPRRSRASSSRVTPNLPRRAVSPPCCHCRREE